MYIIFNCIMNFKKFNWYIVILKRYYLFNILLRYKSYNCIFIVDNNIINQFIFNMQFFYGFDFFDND